MTSSGNAGMPPRWAGRRARADHRGQRAGDRGARRRPRPAAGRHRARPRGRHRRPRRSAGRPRCPHRRHRPLARDGRRRAEAWDPERRSPCDGHAGDRPRGRECRRCRLAVRVHAGARPRAGAPRNAPRAPSGRHARVRDVGARAAESLGDGLWAAPDRTRADGASCPRRPRPVHARRTGADPEARPERRLFADVEVEEVPIEFRFGSWDDYRQSSRAWRHRCARRSRSSTTASCRDRRRCAGTIEPFRGADGYAIPGVALVTRAV